MPKLINTWIARCYLWACQQLYDELAWSYDSVSWLISLGRWSAWRRAALAYLPTGQHPLDSADQILEIGFGTGELLIEMTQRNFCWVGLERSVAMHRIVTAKLLRRQLRVPRVRGDAQVLPFAAETFAAVVATFPAGYILAPATLHEAYRVLRRPDPALGQPGGRLIIVGLWVSIKQPWLAALLPVFYGKPDAATLRSFQERLSAAGLRTELQTYDDGLFSVGVVVGQKT